MTRPIHIVEAVRTPVGRFQGALRDVRADSLAAICLNEVVARAGVPVDSVDDVILGCVTQIGEQCGNVARTAVLTAGWAEQIPGMTIDRKCGSGEIAVQIAGAQIAAGKSDLVVAGGAENMTRVPMGSNRQLHGEVFGPLLMERFELVSQGEAAERIADKWGFSRADTDAFAFESHSRAIRAAKAGAFEKEIVPVRLGDWSEAEIPGDEVISADETIRWDTSAERLSGLKSSFREVGCCTAGNSSQISDGAAVLLLASDAALEQHGLTSRARILDYLVIGSDPILMLTGPIAATQKIMARNGLTIDDIDLFEVNEAFAPVPMAWLQEIGAPHEKLNVNGGAIALGHPLGASGARIMTSLLHEMERRGAKRALQSICCAGGMATATIIERA